MGRFQAWLIPWLKLSLRTYSFSAFCSGIATMLSIPFPIWALRDMQLMHLLPKKRLPSFHCFPSLFKLNCNEEENFLENDKSTVRGNLNFCMVL